MQSVNDLRKSLTAEQLNSMTAMDAKKLVGRMFAYKLSQALEYVDDQFDNMDEPKLAAHNVFCMLEELDGIH